MIKGMEEMSLMNNYILIKKENGLYWFKIINMKVNKNLKKYNKKVDEYFYDDSKPIVISSIKMILIVMKIQKKMNHLKRKYEI